MFLRAEVEKVIFFISTIKIEILYSAEKYFFNVLEIVYFSNILTSCYWTQNSFSWQE